MMLGLVAARLAAVPAAMPRRQLLMLKQMYMHTDCQSVLQPQRIAPCLMYYIPIVWLEQCGAKSLSCVSRSMPSM